MSVLTDLESRLVDAGITASIALGRVPDQPDVLIALREYPAEPSLDVAANGLPALERRAVQMLARCGKDAGIGVAEDLAWVAYRALVGRHVRVLVGSDVSKYDYVLANHTPAHLGFDANDRPLVVCNFSIQGWGDVSDD